MTVNRKKYSALILLAALMVAGIAQAEVFHSKESALRLAFPNADAVNKKQIFLDKAEAKEVEQLARVRLDSRLVTMYVGRRDGAVAGYAFIETHTVRSLPETILLVLEPDGRARGVYVLAFHEPPEYAPSERWLQQFAGRPLNDALSLRGDVAAITGATITANSITAAVRRTLAIFEVAVGSEESDDSAGSTGASAGR